MSGRLSDCSFANFLGMTWVSLPDICPFMGKCGIGNPAFEKNLKLTLNHLIIRSIIFIKAKAQHQKKHKEEAYN